MHAINANGIGLNELAEVKARTGLVWLPKPHRTATSSALQSLQLWPTASPYLHLNQSEERIMVT